MSTKNKKYILESESDYITLSNLICKGIFDEKLPVAKFFTDYELGDEINQKVTDILEKLEKELIISKEDHQFLIDLLTTLFFKLKSHIVELVDRISMAEQGLMYRDKILKDKEERHHSQLKFFVNKIKELEKQNITVQDKNKEIERLSNCISTLSLTSIDSEEKLAVEMKKNKNLQNELNIVKSKLQKEINELKNQKDKQNERIIELEKNINSNTQIIKNNKNLETKLDEIEINYNELKNKYNEQEDKFRDLNLKYKIEIDNKNKLLLSIDELNQLKITNLQNFNELSEKNNQIIKLTKQINTTNDFEKIILNKDNEITMLNDKMVDIQKKYDELLTQSKIIDEDKNKIIKKNRFISRNNNIGRGFGQKNGYIPRQNIVPIASSLSNSQNSNQSMINDYNCNINPVICYVPVPVHPGFPPFPMNPYEQPYEPGFVPWYPNQIYENGFCPEACDESICGEYQSNSNQPEDNTQYKQESTS